MCLQRMRRLDTTEKRREREKAGLEEKQREAQLMKESKGVVKVSRHPLYCRAGAVKTS